MTMRKVFTLIELLVVIAAIAFVAYAGHKVSGHRSTTTDGTRIASADPESVLGNDPITQTEAWAAEPAPISFPTAEERAAARATVAAEHHARQAKLKNLSAKGIPFAEELRDGLWETGRVVERDQGIVLITTVDVARVVIVADSDDQILVNGEPAKPEGGDGYFVATGPPSRSIEIKVDGNGAAPPGTFIREIVLLP